MPCAGSGRGHGRSSATSGAQSSIDEHGLPQSIPPFQPNPFQATCDESGIAMDHRITASNMIHTQGPAIDTLQQHQSSRRTQLPQQERLRPYVIPSSRTPSQHTSSRASMSTMSLDDLDDDGTCSQRVRRGSKRDALRPLKIGFYNEQDKENIYLARKLMVLDMILETGWEDNRSALEDIARECLSSACARNNHVTESTSAIVKLVMDELPNIRGKLVQEAEGCLPALGLQPDNTLSVEDDTARIVECSEVMLNERSMHTYFLHGWDAARMKTLVFSGDVYWNLHESFWFGRNSPFLNDPVARARISTPSWVMYELTGAALYCAIHHAATGRLSKTKNVLQFSTQEFQPVAIGIRTAINKYLNNPELDEGEFLPRMTGHHAQCLKALRSHTGDGSPTKNYNIYVPSSSPELYWLRTDSSATLSTPSSTSLPSLAYPRNATASSSSASSGTSWYPQHATLQSPQDEHYAPYVPDDGHHTGHGDMPWCPQPPNYMWQDSLLQAKEPEVALVQGDGPSSAQDDDDDDLYFNAAGSSSTSALAGYKGQNFRLFPIPLASTLSPNTYSCYILVSKASSTNGAEDKRAHIDEQPASEQNTPGPPQDSDAVMISGPDSQSSEPHEQENTSKAALDDNLPPQTESIVGEKDQPNRSLNEL
ncbi:hypothetical protein BDR06DRAFT_1007889 [Suillus hirtellus]|nr:hypothetical protein BDR06DRAFT_1007889 [Suillus hirtellus]